MQYYHYLLFTTPLGDHTHEGCGSLEFKKEEQNDKVKKYTYEGSFKELLNWAVLVRAFSFNEVLQE